MPECCQPLRLTKESLDHFTAHLANGPTDPLVAKLQSRLATHLSYQELCLKYVIGTVAISGKLDECSLGTIFESCNGKRILHLSSLLDELRQKNDHDTVARLIADIIGYRSFSANFIKLIARLIRKDWRAMEVLTMKVLEILKNNAELIDEYHLMVKKLPAERQYEIIRAREIPLNVIGDLYDEKDGPLLRGVFFLARCSCNPDPELRACIADRFPSFKQCLADDGAGSRIERPCPERIPELTDDAICHISRFVDVETVGYVWPMVCMTWRKLYWGIMIQDTRIHDLYLQDLNYKKINAIHRKAPWNYCLRNEADAQRYLGRCIEDGAFGRAMPTKQSQSKCNMREYFKAVIKGRTALPGIGDGIAKYEAFIKLFEMVYEFCDDDVAPDLGKPEFLTDGEYEQAVHHLVYEKRWVLQLPEWLTVEDMPKLFKIIKEDEEVMKRLTIKNFYNYTEASLALIVCGQTREIPEKLAKLMFGRTHVFERLVSPKIVSGSEYYGHMAESNMLADVIKEYYHMAKFPRFLVSLILSFRNTPEKIDSIAASMARKFATWPYNHKLQTLKQYFETIPFENLMATEGRPAEDFEFFRGAMVRCGLL